MTVITVSNFKGGVGKTTFATIFAYLLQSQGKKVGLIDFDPQANATEIIFNTFDVDTNIKVSLFEAIQQEDLSKAIVKATQSLDVFPSELDLVGFPAHLYDLTKDKTKRFYLLKYLIDQIKNEYDYIIIDVPPTISEFTNNAIVASDYVALIMQTHQQSFASSVKFIEYLKDLVQYNENIDLAGVIPYLVTKKGKVDNEVLEDAKKIFGDHLFNTQIMKRERIKLFSKNGITNDDMHDKAVLKMYQKVVDELLERIGKK
ncbi:MULTISPECIES: ParA family protein [Bacillus cereus group]|uniref:Chromosome partitioning protein n=1 Tax=Bacillus thuringiensis serovar toumanoffi TaxID=180862 RepID=A0ABD5I9L8_BACTU|nr:ParA family protein [Bacillus thuringiensis]EEM93147.1 Chromosome partitioning ATPase [Bacillus thuringiensis IBL 200]MCR6784319.1 ParA family protein [Bacillus thuringiensis]MCR6863147.1 ParA family protein [Bacillus thuringiensis]MCR6869244.1 ParA family protein [Bacillus thuringiensis]MDW9214009.1 chromosome partitioning protein [Bacillus thuringiensis serovar toumanoffi]